MKKLINQKFSFENNKITCGLKVINLELKKVCKNHFTDQKENENNA